MHKRLYITDTSQSSLLPRRGFCSPVSCWLLCSSTHCHEVAHYLSLSASLGGAHGFISCSLFLCLLSFPLADFQAATLVGAAHPSKLGHIHHRLVVSRRWPPQVRSDLLPTGVTWVTAWMLGLFFVNFMVSFVLFHPLQISLMELKKNVYCLLWMATPTVRGKSR